MKRILILGHKGMLGNVVHKYLGSKIDKYTIHTTTERFDNDSFRKTINESGADIIINCIGAIPQKKPSLEDYKKLNIDLPAYLETLGIKVIHPSTDCEFSGKISADKKYKKTDEKDAEDEYSKSKATIANLIEKSFKNTKIIRTSIIGHEENTNVALLDWFLNSSGEVKGFTNHYWNGITTLQWAKLCEELIDNWDNHPTTNQFGTKDIRSKFDLLNDIKNVYGKDINIIPFDAEKAVNKCLESDKEIPSILEQLKELKEYYNK